MSVVSKHRPVARRSVTIDVPHVGKRSARPRVHARVRPRLNFFGEFLRQPWTTGSVWPSSRVLSRAVVENCALCPDEFVVELGPGTGPFTELLIERVNGNGRIVAVEINSANAEVLRKRFPNCEVVNDSAEHLTRHLPRTSVDCIISGLAWGNMRSRMQDRIFRAILKTLAPNGRFVGFAYAHARWFPTTQRFRKSLERYFDRVEITPIVWRNLPPAYVYRCYKSPRPARIVLR